MCGLQFAGDAPIHVDIDASAASGRVNASRSHLADIKDYRGSLRPSVPRISLIHVNRNREGTNLVPWTAHPPRPNSQDVLTIDGLRQISHDTLRIDLRSFRVRDGWTPGKYHVSLRAQNFHRPNDRCWSSEISAPQNFEVR